MCFFFCVFLYLEERKKCSKIVQAESNNPEKWSLPSLGVTGAIYSLEYEFQGSSWLLDSEKVWNLKIQ